MDLHELAPVGRWATSGRHRWRLERIAEVCENLTSRGRSHPGLRPLANLSLRGSRLLPAVCSEPDVTAAVRALERKLPPQFPSISVRRSAVRLHHPVGGDQTPGHRPTVTRLSLAKVLLAFLSFGDLPASTVEVTGSNPVLPTGRLVRENKLPPPYGVRSVSTTC
jgi:hypothetical protein